MHQTHCKPIRFALSGIFLLLFCQSPQVVEIADKHILDDIITSEYKRLQLPGLAYAAVRNDTILYIGAKGYADRKKEIPFTTKTRITIASTSKTFVATAIMQLYEKGLLQLDDDVNSHIPFTIKNPYCPDETITIKMLLTHTSSICERNYTEVAYYLYGYVDYPESVMSFSRNFLTENGDYYSDENYYNKQPGTYFAYSNIGAGLLACIVEYITGITFNEYCKLNIFEPLGMTRTTWFYSETPKSEVAIPYGENYDIDPDNPFYTYPTYPDGHLTTTVEDLSRFLRAYINDGTFNGFQLLKSSTLDLIFKEYCECRAIPADQQGLLFHAKETGNRKVWGHAGGDLGEVSSMYFDRERHTGYIMMNNLTTGRSEIIETALLNYADN